MLSRPDKDLVENPNYASTVIPHKLKQKLGSAMTTDTQSVQFASEFGYQVFIIHMGIHTFYRAAHFLR